MDNVIDETGFETDIKITDEVNQLLLERYLWGNRTFPQGAFGLTINAAEYVISQKSTNAMKFAARRLSDNEAGLVCDAMNKVHVAQGVNIATEKEKEMVQTARASMREIEEVLPRGSINPETI